MSTEFLSLKPSDHVDGGGGLFDDFDGKIVKAEYVKAKYGSMTEAKIVAKLYFKNPEARDVFDRTYSCGELKGWEIAEGGRTIAKVAKDVTPLSKTCNYHIFLDELVKGGYPEDQLSSDITALVGLEGHLKDKTITRTTRGQKQDSKVLCFTRIDRFPWDTAAAVGGKANGETTDETDLSEQAIEAVKFVLAKAKKPLSFEEIQTKAAIGPLLKFKNRRAIKDAITADLLTAGDGELWEQDGEAYKAL